MLFSVSFSFLSLISSQLAMTDGLDDDEMTGASGIMSGAFGAHALKARLGDQAATWVSLAFSRFTRFVD